MPLAIAAVLVVWSVAGCSGASPSPSQSGSPPLSDDQLTEACRQAASQSAPEKLTPAVAQSLSGKQVLMCVVDAQKASVVLHTAPATETSKIRMSYVTPGESLPPECKVLTGSSFYIYDGSAFLLARFVECSYGAGTSPS